MLPLLAALMAASPAAAPPDGALPGRTEWIFSTLQHSEFCPAGNVRLDLRTGLYAFTARAPRRVCHDSGLERPVVTGRLDSRPLEALRAAYRRAVVEGLESRSCEDGKHPEEVVISNGGTPILILSTGAGTGSAPDDLSCWSEAASALHGALGDIFASLYPPPGKE